MNNTIRLLKNELKRFFQNDVLVAIFFGAPLVYGILFGFVYKQAKVINLPVAVVDEDHSTVSEQLIEAINENENLAVKKIYFDSHNLQQEQLKNDFVAVIHIPESFQSDLFMKRYPEVLVELNMSNILNANFASKSIQKVLGTIKAGIEIKSLKMKGLLDKIARNNFESFKITYHKLYNPNSNYLYFMLPALLGAIMQQVIFLAMALVFSRDFEDGYWNELLKYSKNPFYLIFIKFLPYFVLSGIVWTVIGLIYNYFEIDFNVLSWTMFWIIILFTLAAMFIGMLFSILIPSQLKSTEFLMVISTPAFILSGFTWPLSAMPNWITQISNLIPLTHFLTAFKKIAMYGGTLGDVSFQIYHLTFLAFISFLIMLMSLKYKIVKNSKK